MSRWAPRSPSSTRRTTSALCVGVAADELLVRRRRQAQRHRVDGERAGAAVVLQGEHGRGPGRRELVEPAAVDDPRVGRPVGPQRRQHPLGEAGVGDADHLAAHPTGVGHRTEQVEHRRDADLAARRGGEAERRVEPGREAEADAGLLDAAQHARRRQLDARRRAPRARRPCRTATTPPGRRACTPAHRRRPRRCAAIVDTLIECERSPPVPTMSTARAAQVVVERHQLGRRQHRVEQPGQLVGRLALGPQGDDEPDQLGRRGAAAEDRRHRRARLVGRQVTPGQQLGQQARPPAVTVQAVLVGRQVSGATVRSRQEPRRRARDVGGRSTRPSVPALRRCGGVGG